MKVLLTGANGHLGANTARELLKRNHEVVAFVRPNSDLRSLKGLSITYAQGDVRDGKSLARAAADCDAIIHSATLFAYWAKNPALIEDTALEGARNVVAAAKDNGVKRLIYTSSSWAIGLTDDPAKVLSAQNWNDQPHSPYARAKTYGERIAWELADEAGVPMISFCPGAFFGAHDYRKTPSNRMLLEMANGSGRTFNAGLSMADVRDVAAIHALAVDRDPAGKRYAITQYLPFVELGRHVAAFTGKEVKHFGAPKPVARLVGGAMELGALLTGKEPPITRGLIDDAAERYMYVDGSPTWEEFEHAPFTIRETVRASLQWFVQVGWLEEGMLEKTP